MKHHFHYSNFIIRDKVVYFTSNSYNAFCIMEIEKGVIEIIGRCEKEPCNKQNLFYVDIYENYLLYIPNSAHVLVVYDISTKEKVKEIQISNYDVNRNSDISNWIINKQFLYLFPGKGKEIIVIDIHKMKVVYKIDLLEKYYREFMSCYSYFAPRYCCVKFKDRLYLPCYKQKAIVEYNIQNNKIDFIRFDDVLVNSVYSLIMLNEKIILLDEEGFFYEIKDSQLERKNQTSISDIEEIKKGDFLKIINYDGYLLLISSDIRYAKIIDTTTWYEEKLLEIEQINEIVDAAENIEKIRLIGNETGKLYFITGNQKIVCLDVLGKKVEKICNISYSFDDIKKVMETETGMRKVQVFRENLLYGFTDFIGNIINEKSEE